ncbi:hypothetical protein CAPTEDRAFT_113920, partial [Capitella teleta]
QIEPASRYDCGFSGIMESECQERECCFNSTTSPPCFYPEPGSCLPPCDVAEDQRLDCGSPDTGEEECLEKGCCYSIPSHNHYAPWCFHDKNSQ